MKELKPYGFIYMTTNIVNCKKYIGQRKYYRKWERYLGSGALISKAIKKYGIENFIREILVIAYSKEELNILEIKLIKEHKAVEKENYYNLSYGGEAFRTGIHLSDVVKDKMRISNVLRGTHLSKEFRRKLSISRKGMKFTDEHKQNLSKAHTGENNFLYGKHLSEETKLKISQSRKGKYVGKDSTWYGKHRSEETKRKIGILNTKLTDSQITDIRVKYETGNYSMRELAKEYKCVHKTIGDVINYRGGYKYKSALTL